MKHFFFILFSLATLAACGQCPGPAVRTALINLQKSGLVEGTLAGQIPLTDICGNQRYSQYTEIELVPVGFTPTSTGNTSNLSEFVTDPAGDVYYIDWQGNGLRLSGAAACDADFLEIDTNLCPDNIQDSIYTKSYTAFGARYVWPFANVVVIDSTHSADVIISGNRDARLGLYNNLTGDWCGINQSGAGGNIYVGPNTSTFDFIQTNGTNPATPSAPFDTHMSIDFDNEVIRINKYPDTRDDTTDIINFLTTDPAGYIRSHPIGDFPNPGVMVAGPLTGSGTSLFPLDILNESIDSSRLKNGGVSRKDITPAPGLSVMARDSNSTGYLKYLPLTANQVLRVNPAGTILGGGAVNLASSAAVSGTLPTTNLNTTSVTDGVIIQQGNTLGNSMIIGTNDNNTVTIETNNAGKLSVGTLGTLATFSDAATTAAVVQAISNSQTTSGTAANGFGLGQLYNVESSSGNLRAIGQTDWVWGVANDVTRTMRYVINGVNNGAATPSEMWRMEAATVPVMKIAGAMGTPGTTTYANTAITPGASFTLGGSASAVNIGQNTGVINLLSLSALTGAISLGTTSTNTNCNITIGSGTAFNNTTGKRYVTLYNDGHTVASGSGGMFYHNIAGTFNETGSTGLSGVFDLNPTLTAVSGGWAFVNNTLSNSGMFIINSTGVLTRSNHFGPFGFGAATTGTDKVEVTGNIALMTAGNKIKIATGSNASVGTATLVGGTVTVSTTAVTASSIIFVSYDHKNGTPGTSLEAPAASIVPGTSFVINATSTGSAPSASDVGTVNWWIIN